jgi:hypothetical protein
VTVWNCLELALEYEETKILHLIRPTGRKRGERNELGLTGEGRHQEARQRAADCTSDDLREDIRVRVVGQREPMKVAWSLCLEDHRRGISMLQEHEVEYESAYPAVAVDEGVNPL